MDVNPFDPWYEMRTTSEDANSFIPDDWTYFTIKCDGDSNAKVEEKHIRLAEIDDWVLRRV
jgi:hypothetical protein